MRLDTSTQRIEDWDESSSDEDHRHGLRDKRSAGVASLTSPVIQTKRDTVRRRSARCANRSLFFGTRAAGASPALRSLAGQANTVDRKESARSVEAQKLATFDIEPDDMDESSTDDELNVTGVPTTPLVKATQIIQEVVTPTASQQSPSSSTPPNDKHATPATTPSSKDNTLHDKDLVLSSAKKKGRRQRCGPLEAMLEFSLRARRSVEALSEHVPGMRIQGIGGGPTLMDVTACTPDPFGLDLTCRRVPDGRTSTVQLRRLFLSQIPSIEPGCRIRLGRPFSELPSTTSTRVGRQDQTGHTIIFGVRRVNIVKRPPRQQKEVEDASDVALNGGIPKVDPSLRRVLATWNCSECPGQSEGPAK
jgi:hypothetical protein